MHDCRVPGNEGQIGDGNFIPNQILLLRQHALQHPEDPLDFVVVPLYRAGDLFGVEILEPRRLTKVWAGSSHQRGAAYFSEGITHTLGPKPGRRAIGARCTCPGRCRRACDPCRTYRPNIPILREFPWISVSHLPAVMAPVGTYQTTKSLLWWSMMAGMRPLGLIFKYVESLCSFLLKSKYTDS